RLAELYQVVHVQHPEGGVAECADAVDAEIHPIDEVKNPLSVLRRTARALRVRDLTIQAQQQAPHHTNMLNAEQRGTRRIRDAVISLDAPPCDGWRTPRHDGTSFACHTVQAPRFL